MCSENIWSVSTATKGPLGHPSVDIMKTFCKFRCACSSAPVCRNPVAQMSSLCWYLAPVFPFVWLCWRLGRINHWGWRRELVLPLLYTDKVRRIISLCYNCLSCSGILISVGMSGIKSYIVRQEVGFATKIRGHVGICHTSEYETVRASGQTEGWNQVQPARCGSEHKAKPVNLFIIRPYRCTYGFLTQTS